MRLLDFTVRNDGSHSLNPFGSQLIDLYPQNANVPYISNLRRGRMNLRQHGCQKTPNCKIHLYGYIRMSVLAYPQVRDLIFFSFLESEMSPKLVMSILLSLMETSTNAELLYSSCIRGK
jgi:hypothetical protein